MSVEVQQEGGKALTSKLNGCDGGGVVVQGLLQVVVLLHI